MNPRSPPPSTSRLSQTHGKALSPYGRETHIQDDNMRMPPPSLPSLPPSSSLPRPGKQLPSSTPQQLPSSVLRKFNGLTYTEFEKMAEKYDSNRKRKLKEIGSRAYESMMNRDKSSRRGKLTAWEIISAKTASDRIRSHSQTQRGRIDNGRKLKEHEASKKRKLEVFKNLQKRRSLGGNSKIYIGPKNGKFIIKNGSKVYIDRNSLSKNVQYKKKTKSKKI